MQPLIEIAHTLAGLKIEYLVIFVALAGIGLAAFAIHAIASIVKNRERR